MTLMELFDIQGVGKSVLWQVTELYDCCGSFSKGYNINSKKMSIKDFTILAKLGEGAYSTVYKVERKADSQQYALKKVKLGNLSDKQAENALNQVRILASIRHQNIVSYKEAFLQGKSLCIVMEFADDGDLYHKISDHKKRKQYFEEDFIWKLIINCLRGLKELHDLKILHRDLKTANIFLNKDGRAQLGDMNVSKIAQNGLLYTQTGTPYYASPQVWSQKPYDSKSDIWSLGCVFYQTVALDVPFKAQDMEGLMKTVTAGKYDPVPSFYSKDLAQFIYQMLQLKPKNRPSAEKMLKSGLVQKKVMELKLKEQPSLYQKEMLSTIKMPKKLQYLTDRLPKSNYSLNLSYQAPQRSTQKRREQRQRTNTLPKLDRILRYHQDIIQSKPLRQKKPQILNDRRSNILYVEGITKNINEIKVGLPDRKDRIQQEINRIYQGKHAVYRRDYSRDAIKPGIRRS